MNKKGEGEIFLILIVIGILFGFINAIDNNEYKDYMEDCKKFYREDFYENSTCYNILNEVEYECEKLNRNELNKFCQNNYINSEVSE